MGIHSLSPFLLSTIYLLIDITTSERRLSQTLSDDYILSSVMVPLYGYIPCSAAVFFTKSGHHLRLLAARGYKSQQTAGAW